MPKPINILFLFTIIATGCSAKVDVINESATLTTKTSADLDLFQLKPDSQSQAMRQEKRIVIGNHNIVIDADHLHLHRSYNQNRQRTEAVYDDECRWLREEHLARITDWQKMPSE